MAEDEYEVGYGKPPKKTRFVKGRSGNPKGRPKGSKDFASNVREVLDAKVGVTENGTTSEVTSQKATLLRLREKALNGDARALKMMLDLAKEQEDDDNARKIERGLNRTESDILERYVDECRKASSADNLKDQPMTENNEGGSDDQ